MKLKVKNPKKLFVVDAIGAFFSAFMLGVVLVRYESLFGIPKNTLYLLALLPMLFALFDFYSIQSSRFKTASLLKIISGLNILYCILSLIMAFGHLESITFYGWCYLIIEILVVLSLAIIEYSAANKAMA